MENSAYVKTASENELITITFYHPAHNSLPSHLLNQLCEAIDEAGKTYSGKLILLQSAGNGTFCAGASFDELLAITDEETGKAFFSGFAKVINAIRQAPQLVIGRVQGKAVGGGVGLAAACDYCFATEKAAVKLSELSINIGPFVISPAVKRKIGLSAFTKLSLNPTRFFDADWAKNTGLYHHVSADARIMDEAIQAFYEPLAGKNAAALTALKTDLWQGTEHWDVLLSDQAAISGRLVLSEETRNALQSFKNH